jgi:PAS domain S-box-containing protein
MTATPHAHEVLVVDDNPATRYSTSRVLKAAGFHTREAATGQEALSLADAGVDAVVLDVHLPDIDGFEVCRQLRQRPHGARLPVVHLSAAYLRDDDKVRGLDAGGDAYMTHPAEPALLVATLQALIRARTAEDGRRRSEARFRAIYDLAPGGICLIDTDGRVVDANPAMLRLLERDTGAVVGQPLRRFVPTSAHATLDDALSRSREGLWRGELPLCTPDERLVQLEWSWSAHVEPGVILALATDISERIQISREREQLLDREQAARAAAERVSRSKDEFIAVLSHELRTPLNAILGWVHVLKHAKTNDALPRGLEAIERNAKIQTRLISDILDVSRMDLGKLRLETEPVDVHELVHAAAQALASAAADKSLQLALEAHGARTAVVVDPARLQQIVWNLLTNAIKFSQPGGRIDVRLHQDDTWLTLTVQDQGQGIKPEFLPHLFDRFAQSDSASNRFHGGLGLGLSIVKHLVELHGGHIDARSEGVGRGAAFVVMLPVNPTPARPVEHEASGFAAFGDEPQAPDMLSQLTVLVVEDDDEAREMLTIILHDRGATVRTASSYTTGLQALEQQRPDVLVSDVGMPGEDGHALIREVRRREKATGDPPLPAVALTAFARPQDRAQALAAGFDAHCAKPLRPNDLVTLLLRVTGG